MVHLCARCQSTEHAVEACTVTNKALQLRQKRREKAAVEGRFVRSWVGGLSDHEKRERRLFKRREARRLAAKAEGREIVSIQRKAVRCDAHVERWKSWCRELQAAKADAHVKRWKEVMRSRAEWERVKGLESTRAARIARRARDRADLNDRYVTRLFRGGASTPSVLVDLKREHLRLQRYINNQLEKQ